MSHRPDRLVVALLILLAGIVGVFGYRVLQENRRVVERQDVQQAPSVRSTDPTRGPENAPVTVIVFGDFQCPLCRSEQNALLVFAAKYADRVRVVWKDFPIDGLHPLASAAAEAARCAQEQDAFWEMADALFEHQQELSEALFLSLAGQLNLDTDRFLQCQTTHRTAALITQSLEDGQRAGVDGTPYYFINSTRVSTFPSSAELDQFMNQF